jgi:phage baseplate assembly protein V
MREIERRVNNIIQIGTIVEVDKSKALARVNVLGRVTDFLPVKMIGNSFIKVFIPMRVGEQVMVVCPYGNANSGFIVPSVFNTNCKEPNGSSPDKAIIEFAGGVKIVSDGENINITAPASVNVNCESANVTAESVNVKANTTTITSETTNNGDVVINGNLAVNGNLAMNGSGGSGTAEITGDLRVSGTIYDSKGDLTNHTHSTSDGATAEAR